MKKRRIFILTSGLILLSAICVFALGFKNCPIDGSSMMWTGRTEVEMGKMLKEYKCPMGHVSWVVE